MKLAKEKIILNNKVFKIEEGINKDKYYTTIEECNTTIPLMSNILRPKDTIGDAVITSLRERDTIISIGKMHFPDYQE